MPHAEKVAVAGATGFIAAQTIADLLAKDYPVRGTVRSLKRLETLGYLTSLPDVSERLELVEADLMSKGSFDAAVAGADAVFHMASPYVLNAADPQKELVEPALKGTLNVLTSCAKAPSVKRVVLTSSMAAVTDEPDSSHVLTEVDWNTKSSLTRNPYYYSKTAAEKAAWDFVKDKKPGFDLVVINPFLVIGPSLSPSLERFRAGLNQGASQIGQSCDSRWGLARRPACHATTSFPGFARADCRCHSLGSFL